MKLYIKIIISITVIFLISFFGYHAYINYFFNKTELIPLSNIGQYLSGTVGIVITFVVALFAYMAYSAQQTQIKAFEKASLKQSFENTFFQLLKYNENIVNTMDISSMMGSGSPLSYQGRKSFKVMYTILKDRYESKDHIGIYTDLSQPITEEKKKFILNSLNEEYLRFDKDYQPFLGYYFRNVYYIIKLVDIITILTQDEKHFYINILRAQLSTYELLLLFYSSLSDRGNLKVKPLIEKYRLLKHIEIYKDKLIDFSNTDHRHLYKQTAF